MTREKKTFMDDSHFLIFVLLKFGRINVSDVNFCAGSSTM